MERLGDKHAARRLMNVPTGLELDRGVRDQSRARLDRSSRMHARTRLRLRTTRERLVGANTSHRFARSMKQPRQRLSGPRRSGTQAPAVGTDGDGRWLWSTARRTPEGETKTVTRSCGGTESRPLLISSSTSPGNIGCKERYFVRCFRTVDSHFNFLC